MSPAPSKHLDQFNIRLPEGMRERLKVAAAHNNRSMNAEIVQALDYWLQLDLPYDLQLGAGSDAAAVGKEDWEDGRAAREEDYKREIQQSIWLMERLLRDLSVKAPSQPHGVGGALGRVIDRVASGEQGDENVDPPVDDLPEVRRNRGR